MINSFLFIKYRLIGKIFRNYMLCLLIGPSELIISNLSLTNMKLSVEKISLGSAWIKQLL